MLESQKCLKSTEDIGYQKKFSTYLWLLSALPTAFDFILLSRERKNHPAHKKVLNNASHIASLV